MPADTPLPSAPAAAAHARLPAPQEPRYGPVAITLHWLLAAMIVASLGVGLYMTGLPLSPARIKLYNWHKWAGVTILLLSALRLLWRLRHAPPPLPASSAAAMPSWQRAGYLASHALMYLLFIAVPLFGWAYSSAMGFPVVWFGLLPLPDFMPVDKELAEAVLKPLHKGGAFTLAALALLHVAAVLKHHWIDRDGILKRMWPAPRKESSQ
ncbi:cytochrome b [Variovorax paradoxus]|uniref:cytochrome b n=1 Tax=Variovorax paradoxus TaxID=34073 RepID=UPI00248041B9|nr:cytochrome b/b6 domain-containing protein [Variovorax paradoxus]WGT61474.1 cytochrome b/b6 domain-containing protein [Variovorax paradoxus]